MKLLTPKQQQQINSNSPEMQLKYMTGELAGLRTVVAYLYDGNLKAMQALIFLKQYKQWPEMFIWLKNNQLTGKKLVEFFQNESPDGGGYHMGATLIISRLDGMKHQERIIKIDELV